MPRIASTQGYMTNVDSLNYSNPQYKPSKRQSISSPPSGAVHVIEAPQIQGRSGAFRDAYMCMTRLAKHARDYCYVSVNPQYNRVETHAR